MNGGGSVKTQEIHESDGSFVKIEDECGSQPHEPCDITFPKIKEEIQWDPVELQELALSCPSNSWIETFCSESSEVVDLTTDNLTDYEAAPLYSRTTATLITGTTNSNSEKSCEYVPIFEEKESFITKIDSCSGQTMQHTEGKCHSSRRKRFHPAKAGRHGTKKRIVSQEILGSEDKPCSCRRVAESCALHPDRKKHFCALCGAMFLWKEYLDLHTASHAQEMPYSCSRCRAQFRLLESLEKHMRFHGARPGPSDSALCQQAGDSDVSVVCERTDPSRLSSRK